LALTKEGHQQVIVRQLVVIKKLTEKLNRHDAFINRIDNDKTAIDALEMFKGDLSRKAFVDRLLKSNEVNKEVSKSESLFTRGGDTYEELSESSESNIRPGSAPTASVAS
jgi:hypothetical protein